jgi:hypothetical protein
VSSSMWLMMVCEPLGWSSRLLDKNPSHKKLDQYPLVLEAS